MDFARSMQLEIDDVDDGVGNASMPLSPAVTFDGAAFAAFAIGVVADVAAGAATLAVTPSDEMAYTLRIDSQITGSTRGTRLSAIAALRERIGERLVFDATIRAHRPDGTTRQCGTAVVTMQITPTTS